MQQGPDLEVETNRTAARSVVCASKCVERGRDGKPLDEGELERRKKRDDAMKILEDPLSVRFYGRSDG